MNPKTFEPGVKKDDWMGDSLFDQEDMNFEDVNY